MGAPDDDGELPMNTLVLIDVVRDDERPLETRKRSLKILERTPAKHRRAVAAALVPALSSSPDVASGVHLALLVLDKDLAVGRDADGRFVAAKEPLDDGAGHKIERGLGRVVGLDELALLFGPDDERPAFLARPDRDAPAPYRPPPEVLEVRRLEARFHEERALHRAKLEALGLDEDDLDDDVVHRPSWVERHRAPTVAVVDEGARIEVITGEDASYTRDVGRAHAGAWWADERAGDHRGARRWYLRLHREAPSDVAVVRRERPLRMRNASVVVKLGDVEIEKEVHGRGVVMFIEEEAGVVVAVTLTWSAWEAFRPKEKASRRGA
jgi:hypothetical protein